MSVLAGIANPSWTAIFGMSLAFALFAAKFVTWRSPKFDDVIVGLAEVPGDLSAACCSLLIALFGVSSHWHRLSLCVIAVVLVFLFNIIMFRLVEERKLSLSTNWIYITAMIGLSYAACILISFNIVSWSYMGIDK